MNQVSRTLEIDDDTGARLRETAAEPGHEVAAALAAERVNDSETVAFCI
jgi:hypothetical protein